MGRLLRWVGIACGAVAGLALVAFAVVYGLSERELRRTYPVPAESITVPTDPASVAEGRRLATILGCFRGCHGPQAEGQVFFDKPLIARIVAPNLTASVRKYSDAELANAIRHGLRPDGGSMVVMPSQGFVALTDEDLGRVIAFLRSLPESEGPADGFTPGPVGRIGFVAGKFQTVAQVIARAAPLPAGPGDRPARGRYLAQVVCVHCHGTDLRGDANPEFTSPDLGIVAAYSPEQFAALMRTGVAIGGRTLGVMSAYARDNLAQMTDAEIAALYDYLRALPAARGP